MIATLLAAALIIHAPAQVELTAPVHAELLQADPPSCEVLNARIEWMRKQAAEVDRLLDENRKHHRLTNSQLRDLEAFRRRWLTMNDDLGKPWARMEASFQTAQLTEAQVKALSMGSYRIAVSALGKVWTALADELPPEWELTYDASVKLLKMSIPATATEFCSPTQDWRIDVVIANSL